MAVPRMIKLAFLPLAVLVLPFFFRREFPVVAPKDALVMVTGTSSGLGREAVRLLHAQGYAVIATVRKEKDVQDLQTEFGVNSRVRPMIMDVTNSNDRANAAKAFVDIAKELNVQPYALINNAGATQSGLAHQVTEASLEWNFKVLVEGPILLTTAVYPVLASHGAGRIQFIGSSGEDLPLPFMSQYTMFKAALKTYAITLRNEVAKSGVAVTHVKQGPAQSKFFDKNIDTKYHKKTCSMKLDDPKEQDFYCDAAAKFFAGFETMPKEGEMGYAMVNPSSSVATWADALSTPYPEMVIQTNLAGRMMVFVSMLPSWFAEKALFI